MFDKKKIIKLQIEDMVTVITMSPIKIKHLDDLDNLKDANDNNDHDLIQDICLKLIEDTIDVKLKYIPMSKLNDMVNIFINFNFADITKNVKHKTQNQNENILQCIDFLISEGHIYQDILNYSIFEFSKFVELAINRKSDYKKKKKSDPLAMLQKIGVKVDGKKN